MQVHDDPELRARVRAELLYPRKRPCDYVAVRTAANAQRCCCGEPAWDVCYDVFLCDACVAVLDAEMNEHARQLEVRRAEAA